VGEQERPGMNRSFEQKYKKTRENPERKVLKKRRRRRRRRKEKDCQTLDSRLVYISSSQKEENEGPVSRPGHFMPRAVFSLMPRQDRINNRNEPRAQDKNIKRKSLYTS